MGHPDYSLPLEGLGKIEEKKSNDLIKNQTLQHTASTKYATTCPNKLEKCHIYKISKNNLK
jgi:hypothetical protein